jgi:SAM-dependent methyltransferase
MTAALDRWRRDLAGRAIPESILDAAPASPYGFPQEIFRRRAEQAASRTTPTTQRAAEALPGGGTVLDVGCGTGATSARVASRASRVIGVDRSAEMLEAFREAITAAGGTPETSRGGWPDAAATTPRADVVVCGHVLYDVQELGPFVRALDDRARSRVVVELTDRHPLAWMNDLWLRFHGVRFPEGPTADDAHAAMRELGVEARREDRVDEGWRTGFDRRADAVALIRTRLCLADRRDAEIADALGDRLRERGGGWSAGPPEQSVATLWWDVARQPG